MEIPAAKMPVFKAGKALKDAIQWHRNRGWLAYQPLLPIIVATHTHCSVPRLQMQATFNALIAIFLDSLPRESFFVLFDDLIG